MENNATDVVERHTLESMCRGISQAHGGIQEINRRINSILHSINEGDPIPDEDKRKPEPISNPINQGNETLKDIYREYEEIHSRLQRLEGFIGFKE